MPIRPQPAHKPTKASRLAVKVGISCGTNEDLLALRLGITGKTLRKHYRAEINFGKAMVGADLTESLFKMAMAKKDTPAKITAIIWAQKNLMRWADRISNEHANADGSPLVGNVTNVNIVTLPDNGRDPELVRRLTASAPPMKLIEGKVIKEAKEAS
jgi:hypothetical protein